MNQDLMLFVNQYNQEQNMKLYNILYELETYKNYKNMGNKRKKKNDKKIANYLNENFNKMDEIELKNILLKCLDIQQIKSLLLNFELKNYKEKPLKQLPLNEFLKKALKLINRYHWKAGGFLFEDNEWLIYKSDSLKYEIKENELLLENTIDYSDLNDNLNDKYLKKLINRLSLIAENIKVELRQRTNEKSKTINILIWITDKNMHDIVEIGL